MSLNVLILGVNGFIGSNLTRRILKETDWNVFGLDRGSDRVVDLLIQPRFHFTEGDITIHREWIEYHVKKCDVVLPLAAIATPATYVRDPLAVFELDFEANLAVVRQCVKYRRRLIFPSTSEVYGMSPDTPYNEETSTLVTGPIEKERWIYSSCKQLMDRVIYAYGKRDNLNFTLFRPFNWFGPRLDRLWDPKSDWMRSDPSEGPSRVVTRFIGNILAREDIVLVDGGAQKRCFLYVDDGIDALMRLIANENGVANNAIFNVGHPGNEASIRELAVLMLEVASECEGYEDIARDVKLIEKSGEEHYGKGYQDLQSRVPCIAHAQQKLGWSPRVSLREGLKETMSFYLEERTSALAKRKAAV